MSTAQGAYIKADGCTRVSSAPSTGPLIVAVLCRPRWAVVVAEEAQSERRMLTAVTFINAEIGPFLPFTHRSRCCGRSPLFGHSLHMQNTELVELTVRGQTCRSRFVLEGPVFNY